MRDKWNVINKNKGYSKIHIATVEVKSKKILSIRVTDEHVHDSKALPELVVDNIIKSDGMATTTATAAIGKLFGDGSYKGNEILGYLGENGILPCIKVRKNDIEWDGKKGTSLEIK